MRDVLVLPKVGSYGRQPIHVDPVQARIAAGAWTAPEAGDVVERADGESKAWEEATAGDDGWLSHPALRGGYAFWTVEADRTRVMMLEASGHGTVYADGAPRAGDPYRNGWVGLPVLVREGANEFLFHCMRGGLRARLVEPRGEAFIELRERTMQEYAHG